MRKPIIAGNWKMNKTVDEALSFAKEVASKIPSPDKVDAVICAPALQLAGLMYMSKDSHLQIGAQNCFFEKEGAFTGEISPYALAQLGVQYVILGHSERREYFFESDEMINKKVHAVLANGLTPIVCCGETLEQYEANQASEVVAKQLNADLEGLTVEQVKNIVIAYEPIWAIGTGKSATQDDAQNMCKTVRDVVLKKFGQEAADAVRIQYGGSVKPENITSYMACPDVDGALVGGASLNEKSFLELLEGVK